MITNKKLEQVKFDDIQTSSPYMIKNFIVANSENTPSNISLKYPFAFEGIVLAICLKGTGKIKINFKEYSTEKNCILTIPPNQIVEAVEHSDDFFVELLAFSVDFLVDLPIPKDYDLPRKIMSKPILKISEEDANNIIRYHSFIVETFNNRRHSYFEQAIRGQLYSLLIEIAALYRDEDIAKQKPSNRNEEIVEQFLTLLRENYKTERSASFYADKLCITTKYLSSTLKKVTGKSINIWLETIITMGAKIMFKSTSLTVLQISEELNFPNPSYFGRFFKKNTKMTPKEYRERQ